jgi:hypothetical protein
MRDLAGIAHIGHAQIHAEGRRRGLDDAELARSGRDGRLSKNHSPHHVGRNLFEQLQLFRSDAVFPHEKPSVVATQRSRPSATTAMDHQEAWRSPRDQVMREMAGAPFLSVAVDLRDVGKDANAVGGRNERQCDFFHLHDNRVSNPKGSYS